MDSLTLIDQKEQLRTQLNELVDKAEQEQRKLSDEETALFETLNDEIRNIDNQIKDIKNEIKEIRKMSKFSLLKAINDVANNRQLDERAQEVVNAGITEMRKAGQNYSGQIVLPMEERAIQATVEGAGQENVAEDKLGILEPLRANLVLVNAGASYMTGLVGNVSIPAYSGSNVGWKGEVDTADNGGGTFTEVNLEPKRLTAYIDVSKQFLIQDSNSAEEMLKRDIVAAIANKLEATILGSEAGSTTKPAGLLNGVSADGEAITYEDIVEMEATLEGANVRGDIKFIVSPSAKATLKTTKIDAGSGKFVMEGNEVNGYPVLSTSAVAGKGVIYGNFNDLVIAQWGGIDLTVDPYTQAANGMVRIVINAYFDAKPRRAEAFVKKVLA
jgi:HK97 family phage major capsid protein